MEPITVATSFASILGLVCNFRQERKDRSADEYKDFTEWLSSKRHTELVDLLAANLGLSQSISALLNERDDVISQKLDILETVMLKIGSQIESVSDIAKYFIVNNELSDQALNIITKVCEGGGSGVFEITTSGGTFLHIQPRNIQIETTEPQFIESDLASLVELGCLLKPQVSASGNRIFPITRIAQRLVENRNLNKDEADN